MFKHVIFSLAIIALAMLATNRIASAQTLKHPDSKQLKALLEQKKQQEEHATEPKDTRTGEKKTEAAAAAPEQPSTAPAPADSSDAPSAQSEADSEKKSSAATQSERKGPYKVEYVGHKGHRHRKDSHE